MTQEVAISSLCQWVSQGRKQTVNGPRDLFLGSPTQAFWAVWRADKMAAKAAGLGCKLISEPNEFPLRFEAQWWKQVEGLVENEAASHATSTNQVIPHPEGFDYFPFQKAGIAFALAREGTLIGDEMGLGKTVQAIGVINADESINRVLIVCPASLKFNWAKELNRWLMRKIPVNIVNGNSGSLPTDGIVIINYDILSGREKQLTGEVWDLAVLDESHQIKNRETKRAQVISGVFWDKKLRRALKPEEMKHPGIKAKRRIAMTGTPIMNKTIELFETLRWLDPSWNGKRSKYAERYCGASAYNGYDTSGATNLPELQSMLRQSYMVRRLKSQVLTELPAKQRSIVEFPVTADMRKVLEAELKEWDLKQGSLKAAQAKREAAKLNKEDKELYNAAVEGLKEAMRVAFEEMAAVRAAMAIAKLPAVIEFCKETLEDSDGKVVIMAHHHTMVDGLVAALSEFGVVRYDGRMSQTAKDEAVVTFQEQASVRVFVGSIRAAGVGLTLTASSRVIFAELDWVPGVVTQAEDRCHRIGQKDSVLVQHLVLEGSLDARMAQVTVEKQRIADAALDDQHAPLPAVKVTAQPTKLVAPNINARISANKPDVPQIPAEKVAAAHQCMKILAGVCDGAHAKDERGFNGADSDFGKSMANQSFLSQKQAVWAIKFANKYRGQLPESLLEVIGIDKNGKKQAAIGMSAECPF